jgi:DNA polymerase-3 subunit beta
MKSRKRQWKGLRHDPARSFRLGGACRNHHHHFRRFGYVREKIMTTFTMKSEYTSLFNAVKLLKKSQDARNSIPILGHITVEPSADGKAMLTASNLDMYLSITVENSSCHGCFTLPRADLERALAGGDKGKLVSIQGDAGSNRDGSATLLHEKLTVELETLPYDDFPIADWVRDDAMTVAMSSETARQVLGFCAGAMSSEETRYYLQGVCLHQVGGDSGLLGAVATDGHRLNLHETQFCYGGRSVIMRDDAVKLALAMMAKDQGSIEISLPQLASFSGWTVVTGSGWRIVAREINGTFPAHTRVIPDATKAASKATMNCDAVGKAASRVARITNKRGPCIVDFANDSLRHAGGDGIKALAVDVDGITSPSDAVAVGVNSTYLIDAMSQLGEIADACVVYITGTGDPLRIEPVGADQGRILTVLMPMRY